MPEPTGLLDLSDLAPIEEHFTNPFDGQEYALREASEAVAKRYENLRFKGAVFRSDEGVVEKQLEGSADLRPLLVSGCVFGRRTKNNVLVDPPMFDRAISQQEVEKWGQRVVQRLFERAKLISGIDQPATPQVIERQVGALFDRLEVLWSESRNGDSQELLNRLSERIEKLRTSGEQSEKNPQGATPDTSG